MAHWLLRSSRQPAAQTLVLMRFAVSQGEYLFSQNAGIEEWLMTSKIQKPGFTG
jgi:hypothetical protein